MEQNGEGTATSSTLRWKPEGFCRESPYAPHERRQLVFDLSPKLFEGPTAGQDKRNARDLDGPFLRVGVLLGVDGIFAANVHGIFPLQKQRRVPPRKVASFSLPRRRSLYKLVT